MQQNKITPVQNCNCFLCASFTSLHNSKVQSNVWHKNKATYQKSGLTKFRQCSLVLEVIRWLTLQMAQKKDYKNGKKIPNFKIM